MHVHTPTCMQHALLTQLTSAAHLHAPRCQVPPSSPNEHLKIAFFFRNSVKGERLELIASAEVTPKQMRSWAGLFKARREEGMNTKTD